MDFVDWCEKVLRGVVDVTRASPNSRLIGVNEDDVANHLFGAGRAEDPEFYESDLRMGILDALGDLKNASLITEGGGQYKPTPLGVEVSSEPAHYWKGVCEVKLDAEHEQLLRVVNKLSVDAHEDYVRTNEVENDRLLPELKWSDAEDLLWVISEELEGRGLLNRQAFMGGHVELTANYNGLVWETRRHLLRKCDVFISHASDERAAAIALQEFLLKAFGIDLKVFVSSDYHSIPGGKVWFTELLEALKSAPVTLLLLSESSVGRRWLNFEAGVGLGAGNLVIPLAVTGFSKGDVGHPLSELQARSLSDAEDVSGVIRDISAHLDMPFESIDSEGFAAADTAAGGTKLEATLNQVPERVYEGYKEHRLTIGIVNNSPKTLSDHRVEAEVPNAVLNQSTGYGAEIENRRTAEYRYFRAYGKDRNPKDLHPGDGIPQFFTVPLLVPPDAEQSGALEKKVVVKVFAGDVMTQRIERTVREILEQPPSFG